MFYSCPVIAFDCESGPAEFIADQINGRLIAQDDCPGFIRAVNSYLDDKKSLRLKWAEKMTPYADGTYNRNIYGQWEEMVRDLKNHPFGNQ